MTTHRETGRFRHDGLGGDFPQTRRFILKRVVKVLLKIALLPERKDGRRALRQVWWWPLGLHTALDTSGYLGSKATDALLADTDLVLLDIKTWDADRYRRLTGAAIAPTLTFARRLSDMGTKMWIRFVLVPGLTDDPDEVQHIAAFVSTLATAERVDVLPFHKLGASKYTALGIPFPLEHTPTPDPGLVCRVRNRVCQTNGVTRVEGGLLASGGQAAVEGDLERVQGGFPAHGPAFAAGAGRGRGS